MSSSNSNSNSKLYYTYDEIHRAIDANANALTGAGFDYIIAIGGGGLIPARMLRRIVDVPIIVVTVKFYSDDRINDEPVIVQWDKTAVSQLKGQKCLIVDELYDTGSTLKFVINKLNADGVTDLSALMIHHKKKDAGLSNMSYISTKLKHYFPLMIVDDRWIVYPWEAGDIAEHNRHAELREK